MMENGQHREAKDRLSELIGDYVEGQGSVYKAATNLGISRQCLYRYLNGINKPRPERYEQIEKIIKESSKNRIEELAFSFLSSYTTADLIKSRRILLELVVVLETRIGKPL